MPSPTLALPSLSRVAHGVSAVASAVLVPFEWFISHLLVSAHDVLVAAGLPAASGVTWAVSIAVLVVLVRLALLPLAVHSVRSAQRSAGPQGCLVVLAQAPVLLALFRVLDGAAHGHLVAGMTPSQVTAVTSASSWTVSLAGTLHTGGAAAVVAAGLTLVTAVTLWATQHRQLTRNTPAAALEGPAGRSLRLTTWVLPLVGAVSGAGFPIGVLVYWACTNTWTLVQQGFVLRWLPTPDSPAHAALLSRTARRPRRTRRSPAPDGGAP